MNVLRGLWGFWLRTIKQALLLLSHRTPPGPDAAGVPSDPAGPVRPGDIQPILLLGSAVSSDGAAAQVAAVDRAMRAIGDWYAQQGFSLKGLRRCVAAPVPEASRQKLASDLVLDALADTAAALGFPAGAPGQGEVLPYIFIGFAPGAGGYAGTVRNGSQAGLCGLGDACLAAIAGDQGGCLNIIGGDPVRCSVDGQTGAIAHELLHALGCGILFFTDNAGHDVALDRPGNPLNSWKYQYFPDSQLPPEVLQSLRLYAAQFTR